MAAALPQMHGVGVLYTPLAWRRRLNAMAEPDKTAFVLEYEQFGASGPRRSGAPWPGRDGRCICQSA